MKNFTLTLFAFLLLSTLATKAQEMIYLASTPVPHQGQIIELEGERLQFKMRNSSSKRSANRSNILFFFNNVGNYIVVSSLSSSPVEANTQIKAFYDSKTKNNFDILIKSVPSIDVIRCNINYESDDAYNYVTLNGQSGTINKQEVLAVIKKDGTHIVFGDWSDAEKGLEKADELMRKPMSEIIAKPIVKKEPETEAPAIVKPIIKKAADVQPQPIQELKSPSEWTADERKEYEEKGEYALKTFVESINIISDKTIEGDQIDERIKQTLKLFQPDATVQISSKNGQIRTKKIKEYLISLKLLSYTSTVIEWANVSYTTPPQKEADGNYYGVITGEQKFTGFGQDSKVKYEDITKKNIKVKFLPNTKFDKGQELKVYDILLGNIGIVAER